jgi:hypothetical protein
MQQIADQEFHYLGLGTFSSICRLRAFEVEDALTVVIATELPHNPGTSVTNAAQDKVHTGAHEVNGGETSALFPSAIVIFRSRQVELAGK